MPSIDPLFSFPLDERRKSRYRKAKVKLDTKSLAQYLRDGGDLLADIAEGSVPDPRPKK